MRVKIAVTKIESGDAKAKGCLDNAFVFVRLSDVLAGQNLPVEYSFNNLDVPKDVQSLVFGRPLYELRVKVDRNLALEGNLYLE
jgi:hypothetical protein